MIDHGAQGSAFLASASSFNQHARVLLNLAMGGQWAGRHGIDDSAFPQGLEIDYVRVYRKAGQHKTAVSTIGHDLCPASGC